MNDEILIKISEDNVEKELKKVDFSACYVERVINKYKSSSFKIFNLKPAEANILKQACLSCGFDAAVGRDVITCKCESSDALITGSLEQMYKLIEKLKEQPFRLKELALKLHDVLNIPSEYKIRSRKFDINSPYIMGILNVTPDSFSDGGNNFEVSKAVETALQMIEDGADIIDIGGESTRPEASAVTSIQECQRILPVINAIRHIDTQILLSVDTIHPETAEIAIKADVDILNTVDKIEKFESIFPILKKYNTPVVITHSETIPPLPTPNDFDGDILEHIYMFFNNQINYLKSNGLTDNLFILDPGIGFGKSLNNQFELIKRAGEFRSLNYPVLYGISRKSFIFKNFGKENIDEITKIYNQYLVSKGVNILRVHDVQSHVKLKNYLSKIR